jgi:SAM-dependent methyltransferase
MNSPDLPDSVARNVAEWTKSNAAYTDAKAPEAWASEEISWGVFGVPEAVLGVIGDVAGLDVVELGCGTAYFSAWLAKRGARPVGVDPTPAQLATARRMQAETGIEFPLVEAAAEAVPLPDASFDLALSEYGASLWAMPERWLAEAARLLRPGGRLLFLTNSTLVILCSPDAGVAEERLLRPQFDKLYRIEWPGEPRGGVPPDARAVDPPPEGERLRRGSPARAPGAGGANNAHVYTTTSRSTGPGSGRARSTWHSTCASRAIP